MLKYNIDFEIMGMLVTLVITYYFHVSYVESNRSDKAFKKLLYFILGAEFFDMFTAFTFSLEDPKLNVINVILTTVYFMFAAATAVEFEGYIASYIDVVIGNKIYMMIRRVVFVLYVLHGFLNPFTKLAFYFDDNGVYHHGPLYILGYAIPGLFAVSALFNIIRYRKCFDKKQWVSSVAFILVVFFTMFLQFFVFPDVYLTYGLIPIALLMMLFSLETPDYRKLTNTLDELESAKQEAWHANQVKSDFLANMSHEIRTPINAILGFDEMILRESHEKETIEYATNIKNSGESLLSLVNDILDLSKIEAGKMDIITEEYDVAEMIYSLLKMVSPRALEKDLRVNLEIDPDIPRKLIGDDVRLSQVLTNLLTNAVKYTQKGEITFKVRLHKTFPDEVSLLFAVKDTGVGIKEENTEILFSQFSRVEEANAHKIEGTGLGLPISMKFLMMMGSKLEVKSVYGEGSVFYFFITQQIADAEPMGDFEKAKMNIRKEVKVFREDFIAPDAHVLVVDDVEMNLKVFEGLLKKSHLKISTATSGMEAIKLVRDNSFDCIFMDHQMPEMDGIETLKLLKRDPDIKMEGVPVIALTANAISGARELYMKNGFSDYLTKPIDGWKLSEMLHKWLPKDKIIVESDNKSSEDDEEIMEFLPENNEQEAEDSSNNVSGITIEKLKRTGIDVKSGLKFTMNDESFYLELVNDFLADSKERIAALKDSFMKKDWKNYEVSVHALKSTSKTIGLTGLSEEAKNLEYAARDGKVEQIEAEHDELITHYEGIVKTISEL